MDFSPPKISEGNFPNIQNLSISQRRSVKLQRVPWSPKLRRSYAKHSMYGFFLFNLHEWSISMVNVGKYTKIVPFFVDLGIVFMDPWLPIPSDEAYSLPSKEG